MPIDHLADLEARVEILHPSSVPAGSAVRDGDGALPVRLPRTPGVLLVRLSST
ncbi:hypothetical protein [Streptomyces osmaniensis]|uniref:hypothetical protein n=1 Tax=Streptomyces osmaniensis TaxID=593134 RepID=UPI001C341CA5|nr:hypothetical protein KJK32_41890 [Streptomyces sp. JCM17656]